MKYRKKKRFPLLLLLLILLIAFFSVKTVVQESLLNMNDQKGAKRSKNAKRIIFSWSSCRYQQIPVCEIRYIRAMEEWILCPVCRSKTRIRIRDDTVLINFPLFCPKCKHTTLVNINRFQITIIKEPDAKPQSRWANEVTHIHWLCFFIQILYAAMNLQSGGISVAAVELFCRRFLLYASQRVVCKNTPTE